MAKKIVYSVFLTLVVLTASIYLIFNDGNNQFKIDIQKTRTQYFNQINGSWNLAATEYLNLYDGTTLMRAKSRTLEYYNDSDYVYVTRKSEWKDNITTLQKYTFSIYGDEIESFPIQNELQCINCNGKIIHYEIRDIFYEGITKNIESPFAFGNNMKIEFNTDNDFSWAKVYKQKTTSDKIVVRYKANTDNEFYYVRLYDPIDNITVTLNSPSNNSLLDNPLVTFNASANITAGPSYLTNATLYDSSTGTWGARNTTSSTDDFYNPKYVANAGGGSMTGTSYVWKQNYTANTLIEKGITYTRNSYSSGCFYATFVKYKFNYNDGTNVEIETNGDQCVNKTLTNPYKNKTVTVIEIFMKGDGSFYDYYMDYNYIYDYNLTNPKPITFTNTYSSGYEVEWNMQYCDSDGSCKFANENYTVKHRYINITLNSPANNSISPTKEITFNASANITAGPSYLTNATLYDNSTGTWGARNTTIPLVWYNGADYTTNDPNGFTNPSNAFDGNNGTYAQKNQAGGTALNGSLGKIFGTTIPYMQFSYNIQLYVYDMGGNMGSASAIIQTYDGSIWTDNESIGGISTYDFTSQNFTGIVNLTNIQGVRIKATGSSSGYSGTNKGILIYYEEFNVPRATSSTALFTNTYTDTTVWNMRYCDNNSECFFSPQNYTFKLDYEPIVEIVYPEEITYFEDISQLNYTIDSTYPNKCWFSNNSGITNYSIQNASNNFTINPGFGTHTYLVYCNNSIGLVGSDSITFEKSRINFTGDATPTNTSNNFSIQDWIFSEVDVYGVNKSNTTFYFYTEGGFNKAYFFENDTFSINETDLDLDYYYYYVTVCYNDSGLCYSTETREFGLQTLNFTINGQEDNLIVEVGSNLNLSVLTNKGNVSIDLIPSIYNVKVNVYPLSLFLQFSIDYFTNNLFYDGNNSQTLEFNEINETSGESTFSTSNFSIPAHQYDSIESIYINISGNVDEGNSTLYEPQIVIYKPGTEEIDRAFYGKLIGNKIFLNKLFDRSTGINLYVPELNVSFTNAGDREVYFYLDKGAKITNFLINLTGFKYGFTYIDEFQNDSYLDSLLTTGSRDYSGSLMLRGTNLSIFSFDDFEDSVVNGTKWFKIDDYTEPMFYSFSVSETGGYLQIDNNWFHGNDGYNYDSADVGVWTNSSQFNLRDTQQFSFNLSSIYNSDADNRACDGDAKVTVGGVVIWDQAVVQAEQYSFNQVESSVSELIFNLTKLSNTQWNVKIRGLESTSTNAVYCSHSSDYERVNGIYNWTNGSYLLDFQQVGCEDVYGILNNDFNISVSYSSPLEISNRVILTNGACKTNRVTTKIYWINNSLFYRDNGTFISYPVYSSDSVIESATFNVKDYSWDYSDTEEIYLYLSADGGENWESVIDGDPYSFSNQGGEILYKIQFNTTSPGYRPSTHWIENATIFSIESYPSDIEIDFGDDGTMDYTLSGSLNNTNSPILINLSSANMGNPFIGTPETGQTWLVPLKIYSDSSGIVEISAINLTYNPNPIEINKTSFWNRLKSLLGFGKVDITVGAVNGTLLIDDLNYNYLGGNKTYEFLAYTDNYTINKSINITYYFSQWDYAFGPEGVNYIYFPPKTPTSKNVTPYGQSSIVPILNITNIGYGYPNATLYAYLNSTLPCVNTTLSFSNNKTQGTLLNNSWIELGSLNYTETKSIWLFADLSCNYSNYYLYNPNLYFKQCVTDSICSEDLI